MPPRPLDAWRVLNGAGDGAPPGLTLDWYGPWLLQCVRPNLDRVQVERWCRAAWEVLRPQGLVVKTLPGPNTKQENWLAFGERPSSIEVREGDAVFLCELCEGRSTGLYLDHRDARYLVRRYSPGSRVLNLFAYTCSFSVHAALAQAVQVTSVDVSKKALQWGRKNMTLSSLDPNRHRWFADDVRKHLKPARTPHYDLVVVDPPVFGHGSGRAFSLARDLPDLVRGAALQLKDSGVLVFSTHLRAVRWGSLVEVLRGTLAAAGRTGELLHRTGLPDWDHPVAADSPDDDRGDYLKTLVLRVGYQ